MTNPVHDDREEGKEEGREFFASSLNLSAPLTPRVSLRWRIQSKEERHAIIYCFVGVITQILTPGLHST